MFRMKKEVREIIIEKNLMVYRYEVHPTYSEKVLLFDNYSEEPVYGEVPVVDEEGNESLERILLFNPKEVIEEYVTNGYTLVDKRNEPDPEPASEPEPTPIPDAAV